MRTNDVGGGKIFTTGHTHCSGTNVFPFGQIFVLYSRSTVSWTTFEKNNQTLVMSLLLRWY
jgi:hypothetical protein